MYLYTTLQETIHLIFPTVFNFLFLYGIIFVFVKTRLWIIEQFD